MTLLIFMFMHKFFNKKINQEKKISLMASQSYLHKFLSQYEEMSLEESIPKTQASSYMQKQYVKIMILEQEAYWIKDNQLYKANLINGEIDNDTTHQVDTISMNDVELKKTMFVVEKLTEGAKNDPSSSGESQL
jgi:hypothetical protein